MTFAGKTILVTGGAGFIGSNLIRLLLSETDARIVNLDRLSYAGHRESLEGVLEDPRHELVCGDIGDSSLVAKILNKHLPVAVLHLAAETHVDRSIDSPDVFARTNLMGTGLLLGQCLEYWESLGAEGRPEFRFVHVSTDEVYGTLGPNDPPFTESHAYDPNSPYAASKAGSDHLVRSFWRTYGLPAIVTNSPNNYGPYQFPEKLAPVMILKALDNQPLPLYGDGQHIRDWLYVEDQCRALLTVLSRGVPGESYHIGAEDERTNLEVVEAICRVVDERFSERPAQPGRSRITLVADRPGHDRRYSVDASKIREQLGWSPRVGFEEGIRRTVDWYANQSAWIAAVRRDHDLGQRLGLRGG